MSSLPDMPLAMFCEAIGHFDVQVRKHPNGIVLERNGDCYRLIPFEGWVRGTVSREACLWFSIDPYALMEACYSDVPSSYELPDDE